MALRKVFESESRFVYDRWWSHLGGDSNDPAVPPGDFPCTASHYTHPELYAGWNGGLIGTPWNVWPSRLYGEEVGAANTPSWAPGAVWANYDPNQFDRGSIKFLATVNRVWWPSWGVNLWRLDSARGRLLEKRDVSSGASIFFEGFAVEPDGNVWWIGGAAQAWHGGAVLLEITSTGIAVTDTVITLPGGYAPIAVDRRAHRVFTGGGASSRVYDYDPDTGVATYLATIYAPNEIRSISLSLDGFAYVVDALDWILVYDYDGRLHGAWSNRRSSLNLGAAYGFDQVYKRILRVVNTPSDALGASTLKVEGFYAVPDAAILTPPIPRKVPRKGRTVYFFSHLCGEGGEPITGARATFSLDGARVADAATDAAGDAAAPVTTPTPGTHTLEVDVP